MNKDTSVDTATAAADAVIANAQRLGLLWRIIPATVVGTTSNVSNVGVTVDGDTQQVRAQSLIGVVNDGARVMVLVVPTALTYIIGYYGPSPQPSGIIQRVDSTANTAAITAETITLTGAVMTFMNGRAYRVIWTQRLDHSAAQTAVVRVRKTNIAGTQLSFWQAQVLGAVGVNYYYELVIKRVAGSDLSDNIVLTLSTAAGTVTGRGAVDTVRYLEVWDAGLASEFPNAIAI